MDKEFQQKIDTYNIHTESIFNLLNEMDVEWWPTEGTLIGILRYGGCFGNLPSIGYIGTDTDIDVMIRVESEEEWENLKDILEHKIKMLPAFTKCESNYDNDFLEKLTCFTEDYIGGYDIHTDIHRYLVNEKENYAYTNTKNIKELYYPFQYWDNKIPYKGMIVDDKGKFKKALFNSIEVPCPYKATEILQYWNDGEYKSSEIAYPTGGYHKGTNYMWISNEEPIKLTDEDIKYLQKKSNKLKGKGYENFQNELNNSQ